MDVFERLKCFRTEQPLFRLLSPSSRCCCRCFCCCPWLSCFCSFLWCSAACCLSSSACVGFGTTPSPAAPTDRARGPPRPGGGAWGSDWSGTPSRAPGPAGACRPCAAALVPGRRDLDWLQEIYQNIKYQYKSSINIFIFYFAENKYFVVNINKYFKEYS